MTDKNQTRPAVISSDLFDIPLENGQHIEINCDVILNNVEVQPPRPRPKARLLVFSTHDLGFGQTAVLQVHQVDDRS